MWYVERSCCKRYLVFGDYEEAAHNLFIINLRFLFQHSCSRTKTHCPYLPLAFGPSHCNSEPRSLFCSRCRLCSGMATVQLSRSFQALRMPIGESVIFCFLKTFSLYLSYTHVAASALHAAACYVIYTVQPCTWNHSRARRAVSNRVFVFGGKYMIIMQQM